MLAIFLWTQHIHSAIINFHICRSLSWMAWYFLPPVASCDVSLLRKTWCCSIFSIITSYGSWVGRHHMLLWNAPSNHIQIWYFILLANNYQNKWSSMFLLSKFNCFLQVILGEEVAASKLTLFDLTKQICDAVQARAEQGFGLSHGLTGLCCLYLVILLADFADEILF